MTIWLDDLVWRLVGKPLLVLLMTVLVALGVLLIFLNTLWKEVIV